MEGMVLDALKLKVSHVSWLDDLTIKLFFAFATVFSSNFWRKKKKRLKSTVPCCLYGVFSQSTFILSVDP